MKMKNIIASMATFYIIISLVLVPAHAAGSEKMGWEQINVQTQTQEQVNMMVGSWSQMWSGAMDAAQIRNQVKSEIRAKLGSGAANVNGMMNKFANQIATKTKTEQKSKFQLLIGKIDQAIANVELSKFSEAKKEAYRNLFKYVRVLTEEKIALLDESN